ncbi:polysaccharide biosynthesis tyrosine autokinase [Novosphingobium sp. Fuku2-ISO-50]|uniref:GumC family protein n=1 Tax=Novosphingobium sp. Fuku2-ISO-50 TaxID=1739114 RepID=UPI00076D1272|nr:polysaccharide biosynthesis tyrosine autokinase [Novosphingobium sp. Fuku2-ISO-50]KUR75519.1 exopolysaccharide biosynthesis protein [Novosphingobium sp. Fuku2-ISO-50]
MSSLQTADTGTEEKQGADLRKLVVIVLGYGRFIGMILAFSLLAALGVTLLTTPRYTTSTSVQIDNQTAQVLGKSSGMDASDTEIASAADTDRFLQTQMDIINSRAIAERVAQRLNLVGDVNFYKAVGKREDLAKTPKSKIFDDTIKALLDHKVANMPRNSRLATISFTATDPALAAKITNAWADEYIQANLQRRFDSSAYAREFVSNQLNEARAKLEQSERDLNSYARSAGLIKTHDESAQVAGVAGMVPNSVTTASLLQLNMLANTAEQQRIAAEQRWNAVSHGDLLNAPEVLGNTTISALLASRAQIDGDLQSERARHLDDFPTVIKLKAQQAALSKQIAGLATSIRNSVKQQYDAALDAENKLNAQVSLLKGSSLSEQDKMVRYNLLSRDADTNRLLYDNLLQRYKELTASAGISASNISIIDRAEVPIKPSAPNIVQYLAIGLVIGILLSAIAVTVRHQLDDAIHIPEDINGKLGIPLLGVIPSLPQEDLVEALKDPKSHVSEGYSSLRSSLLFSSQHGLPKSIAVTSSQPAEGKSTTALALAQSITRLGRSVVLVDVDLRRPSQHAMLNADNKLGLSTVLTQQAGLDDVIGHDPVTNLSYITSGPVPPSPSDLISSDRMVRLIRELEQRFDVVVLDCPPVMGFADAPQLANMVQGTVFVIQADRGRRGSLRSSMNRLRGVRANILGGVLTMFDPTKAANRYTDYYGYDYYRYSYYTDDK